MERRLAAILVADIVGYSRLMEEDEAGTLALVQQQRKLILEPLIGEFKGRITKVMGDGVLVEFGSAVNALECALSVQKRFIDINAARSDDKAIVMRMAINLGDVMVEDGDLYGDGVNVAARLETMAEPGSIWLSEDAYRQVHNKVKAEFEDLGPKTLKNISHAVRAYRVMLPNSAVAKNGRQAPQYAGRKPDWASETKSARPGMVVLPFSNFSGDPHQDYFCHGLTTDITTELSKFASLSLVSSTSATAYRAVPGWMERAGRDYGVRYVLEGSVQKTTDRIRINVQLIDAENDRHLWAERFDRAYSDLFALQDEIIERIVAAMALRVEAAERAQAMRKRSDDLNAYDAFLRGSYLWLLHYNTDETKETLLQSRHWLEKAKSLDPDYARAWAWLALTHVQEWLRSWDDVAALERAGEHAKKALIIDGDDYNTHWILAYYYLHARQFDLAISEYEIAVGLNRNDANLLAELAEAFVYVGQHRKGIDLTRQAMRMYPQFPEWYRTDVAWGSYLLRDYDTAIDELGKIANANADAQLTLAACQAQKATAGARDESAAFHAAQARHALHLALAKRPQWTVAMERRKSPYKKGEDLDHWLDGLRKAGLPE